MSSTSLPVRPLEAGDTDTVHHVFAGLSITSAYHRFGTGLTLLPPRMAAQLAAVEPGRHRVFVAELEGRPVGLARWIRPRGGRVDEVEVALEVADAWQGRGVGRALLAEVAQTPGPQGSGLSRRTSPRATSGWWLAAQTGARPPRDLDDVHRLPVAALVTGGTVRLAVVA